MYLFSIKPSESIEDERNESKWDFALAQITSSIAGDKKKKKKKKKHAERGLARICEIADEEKRITKDDVLIFLAEMNLPPLSSKVKSLFKK